MTVDEVLRTALFALGVVVVLGCAGEMWHGPRSGMSWSQFLRYASLFTLVSTIMVAQYNHWHNPITGYTLGLLAGALFGSLGVLPAFNRPMSRRRPAGGPGPRDRTPVP